MTMADSLDGPVAISPTAASVAQMVIELAATADRFGRDWRPTLAEFIQLRLERFQQPEPTPKGFKWALVPDYPTGDVFGACICGSWPGGKCLRCHVVETPE